MACLLRTTATTDPEGRYRQRGFTLIEMTVTLTVLGLLVAMAIPAYLSYRQSAVLKSGAQQIVTMINVARELALGADDSVCANLRPPTTRSSARGGCSGSVWIGAGTDPAGNVPLPEGVTV